MANDQLQDNSGSMPDLDGEVVTLTHLPRSRWQTLLNLDVIQVNFMPFFCFPHIHSLRMISKETNQKSLQRLQRRHPFSCLPLRVLRHGSWFKKRKKKKKRRDPRGNPDKVLQVHRAPSFKSYRRSQKVEIVGSRPSRDDRGLTSLPDEAFFTIAKSLSPAAADLEIRSLATVQDLSLFLGALSQRLKSRRDFEAVQTYLNLFLRVHGELLVSNPELRNDLEALLSLQKQESSRLLDSIASCLGTLAFVRDTL
jgi:U3 small nucleolar RNA-associated protein 21